MEYLSFMPLMGAREGVVAPAGGACSVAAPGAAPAVGCVCRVVPGDGRTVPGVEPGTYAVAGGGRVVTAVVGVAPGFTMTVEDCDVSTSRVPAK